MAVIFVEGFTGFPRESVMTATTSSLLTGGYLLPNSVNESSAPYPSWTNYTIQADSVFADRNVLRLIKNATSTQVNDMGINWSYGLTTNPNKVVLGFTLTASTPAAAKYAYAIRIGTAYSAAAAKASLMYSAAGAALAAASLTEAFAVIDFNDANVASPNAGIKVPGNASASGSVAFTPNAQHHIEFLLEQDVNRIRMYVDGTLVGDGSFPGVLANMNTGFCIEVRAAVTGADKYVELGNFYALAVDSVHTGILGPTARVVEVAPASDAAVQWARDETKYSSNAALLAQNYSGTDFLTAMDAGTTDLFNMPAGVATNAAQIFGVGVKMAAKSLTDTTHAIKATVRMNGVSIDSTEAALPLNTNTVFVRDGSINPNTNAIWKPAEVSAGQFGYKLSK